MSLTALDDLEHPASGVSDRGCGLSAPISGIGENALDEREEAPRACIEDQSPGRLEGNPQGVHRAPLRSGP
jgi:hypothetical protein